MSSLSKKSLARLLILTLLSGTALSACSSGQRRVASSNGPLPEPSAAKYPIQVLGGDEASFTADTSGRVIRDPKAYDVVIVGAGLAGLSAAVFLTDHGKSVLLLEKEPDVGGLAAGLQVNGMRFDRGAAYWTDTYPEEGKILKHIGLNNFHKKFPIPEPIDSYLWNGKLYEGIWEEKTLEELPASFALFRHVLKKASEDKQIPDQPFEEFASRGGKMDLDQYNVAEWIRSMPARALQEAKDSGAAEARAILERFDSEVKSGKIKAADPMEAVIGLMDLYCRSALGTTTDAVSAMAFANFYISEIETRYTSSIGTGQAAENMRKMLDRRGKLVTIRTSTPVAKISQTAKGVTTLYSDHGQTHEVSSNYLVFSAQLKIAPRVIEGLEERSPEQAKLMREMSYSNYSVHNVFVEGHPYRASYDTWTRASDYTHQDFTDVIVGLWMDPEINGYDGLRDFKNNPESKESVLSIYHPLPLSLTGSGYGKQQAVDLAVGAIDRMLELYSPLLQKNYGTQIHVKSAITNRWPFSVHVATPGHFTKKARILRKNFGRVYFANNNLGTPAFEEALFRGHCAANNILTHTEKHFTQEKWTNCPLEK